MIAAFIYLVWLLLLPFGIALWISARMRELSLVLLGRTITLLSLPAYCLGLFYFPGWLWPPDIFTPSAATYVAIDVPGYHVAFVQDLHIDFYDTYFEVIRADGKRAQSSIDKDAHKCWRASANQVGGKIYFVCANEPISNETPYLDVERMVAYSGFSQMEDGVVTLVFK